MLNIFYPFSRGERKYVGVNKDWCGGSCPGDINNLTPVTPSCSAVVKRESVHSIMSSLLQTPRWSHMLIWSTELNGESLLSLQHGKNQTASSEHESHVVSFRFCKLHWTGIRFAENSNLVRQKLQSKSLKTLNSVRGMAIRMAFDGFLSCTSCLLSVSWRILTRFCV